MSDENNSIISFNLAECKKLITTNMARGCGRFEFEQPINMTQYNLLCHNIEDIIFIPNHISSITYVIWMTQKFLELKSKQIPF